MKSIKVSLSAIAAICLGGAAVRADVILNDLNSLVRLAQDKDGRVTGMADWRVDGVDHLASQWFWFRTAGDTHEQVLHSLDQTITSQTDRMIEMTHTRPGLQVDVFYMLIGGTAGSSFSDIVETIRIRNTGTAPLQMSFYQYSDFDLNGTPLDASTNLVNPNVWRQTDDGGGIGLSETSANPTPNLFEANLAPAIISRLNDGDVDNLGNLASAGPGNLTWAWQWNLNIAPGGSFLISKDKQIQPVPEPGAMILLAVGGVALLRRSRRRAM